MKVFLWKGDRLSPVNGTRSVIDAVPMVKQQVQGDATDGRDGRGERTLKSLGADESAERLCKAFAGLECLKVRGGESNADAVGSA